MANIFDFDHTVYDGDVSLDFYFYALRKHPLLIRYIPVQLWNALLYLASINTRTRFKEGFFVFVGGIKNIDEDLDNFWNKHDGKIKSWYGGRPHTKDVIISASPEFIIAPIAAELGVKKLIATRMDQKTGKIHGKNCRGREKVRRLKQETRNMRVEECYSDSLSDLPILRLAERPYIVKRDRVMPLDEYKPSRFKERFFKKSFLTFIFVGVLNAFIGLSFAFLAAQFVNNKTVAYMIGYCAGLIPSYYLNSTMTFHNKDYSLNAFFKYCASYAPNLIVQTSCVGIFVELLRLNIAVAYIGAVIVGVPVTYVLVSVFAIKNREVE